ncbi:hypothetical protein CONLIGDRAFT_637746 [Coniochaeta ligniaria NRRL 30616]|uniref:Uncharacterized protein n=1 Tax=Coniochaeta ligniaria NRRL 30616 TaxID=1408157 RepID=A0A1J7J2E2_9PEZI|nr:hypothetical protein CONLIGDRAFT_637746 [Coniochaeta ligniaria NRRL 30616]
MPTVGEFEAAMSSMLSLPPGVSSSDHLRKLFPSTEDRLAYGTWLNNNHDHSPRPLSASEFCSVVDNKHLVQWTSLGEFVRSTLFHGGKLSVPVGSDSEYAYRLVPGPHGLVPHDRNLSPWSQGYAREPLLEHELLGVNLSVQPREPPLPANRRRTNMSEESTRSGQSDDENNPLAPGFIFFQLGELQYVFHDLEDADLLGAPAQAILARENDYSWESTGFYLVARLGTTGKMAGVYAVHDMFPVHQYTGRREQRRGDNWGVLPRGEQEERRDRIAGIGQFSIARIGDSLGQLGYDRPLTLTERVDHPVELVRVKPSAGARGAVRERVVE